MAAAGVRVKGGTWQDFLERYLVDTSKMSHPSTQFETTTEVLQHARDLAKQHLVSTMKLGMLPGSWCFETDPEKRKEHPDFPNTGTVRGSQMHKDLNLQMWLAIKDKLKKHLTHITAKDFVDDEAYDDDACEFHLRDAAGNITERFPILAYALQKINESAKGKSSVVKESLRQLIYGLKAPTTISDGAIIAMNEQCHKIAHKWDAYNSLVKSSEPELVEDVLEMIKDMSKTDTLSFPYQDFLSRHKSEESLNGILTHFKNFVRHEIEETQSIRSKRGKKEGKAAVPINTAAPTSDKKCPLHPNAAHNMQDCNLLKHYAKAAQQTPNSGNGGSSSNGNRQGGSSSNGNRQGGSSSNGNRQGSSSNNNRQGGSFNGNGKRNNKRPPFTNNAHAPYKRQNTQANAAQIAQQTQKKLDTKGSYQGNNWDEAIWRAHHPSANHVSVAPPNSTSYNAEQLAQAMAAATGAGTINAFHVAPENEEEVDQNILPVTFNKDLTVTFNKDEDDDDYHYDVSQYADDEMEEDDELNVEETTNEVHDQKVLTVIKPITFNDIDPVILKVKLFNDYLIKYVSLKTNDTQEEFEIMRQRHLDGIHEGMSTLCQVTDAKDLTEDQLGNMSYITAMLDAFADPEDSRDWIWAVMCEYGNLRGTLDHFITDPDPVMAAKQEDGMSASDTYVTSSSEERGSSADDEFPPSELNDGHVGATGLTTSESDSDSHISTGSTSSVDEECQSESSIDFSEPEV